MKIIDISWPVDKNTTIQPGEQQVLFEPIKSFGKDEVRETIIHMNAHTGTHVDAPSFLFRDGKSIDQIDLYSCVGPSVVLDMTDVKESIKAEDLDKYEIRDGDFVILKTKNSSLDPSAPYDPAFVYLDTSAAEYLVKKNVKTVGFDYITLEPEDKFNQAHKILLENEITVIGGLRLFYVTQGIYFFFCLPICVLGIESAPARAILLDVSEEIQIEGMESQGE